MEWIAFLISATLLVITAALLARGTGEWRDRFWILVASAVLELGSITSILSLFHLLTPRYFLVCEVMLVAGVGVFVWTRERGEPVTREGKGLPRAVVLVLAPVGLMVVLTGIEKSVLPVSNTDDRLYYASRVAYWMQHGSALHWPAHNDREVMFPITDRLPFFWPVLFTRSETPGLVVFWLAYPLVAVGMYSVLREMGLTQVVSAVGALVLGLTPQVLGQTTGAHSELWVTLLALGCAYWSIRAWRNLGERTFDFAWAGLFAVLAAGSRLTALPLIVSVLLLPFVVGRGKGKLVALGAVAGGMVLGVVLSGWLVTLVENVRYFGHPLGPTAIRNYHAPQRSGYQMAVHSARFVVTLLEPPFVPTDEFAGAAARGFHRGLAALHLDRPLPLEEEGSQWPGPYRIELHRFGEYYSLPGLVWIPALLAAVVMALRNARRTWPNVRLRPISILALLTIPFLLGVVFNLRWMGVMGRFWVAPYALSLGTMVALAADLARRHRWVRIVCIIAVVLTTAAAGIARTIAFARAMREEVNSVALDEPYAEPLYHIKNGATILLVAGQGTRDYPLFAPRAGFVNRVVPWGRISFDGARLANLVRQDKIDYVVIENDQAVQFVWDPPIATGPFVEALGRDPAFREIPLQYSPHMRLFERVPLQSTTWPARTR